MSTEWGPDAGASLRAYVLSHAANASTDIKTVADLSRAAGIKPSVLSKWFRGIEQPAVQSLERLAPVIKAPLTELLVLAARVSADDLGLDSHPEPAELLGHPLARELDSLLAEDSPLTVEDRQSITGFLDQYLRSYRRPARRRRSA